MAYTDWAALANQAAEDKTEVDFMIEGLIDQLNNAHGIKGESYRWARKRVCDSIKAAIADTKTLYEAIDRKLFDYTSKAERQQQREEAEANRAANAQEIGGGT